ncbi:fam-b protein [Plasmodium vinckei lentum]|uniref:Fam-b protein n=1 Tax=Plasmodium vinckei lentum TaxID=138297 RepID=A0A6V7RV52_PLAVN|nr:fam-b protein [Plasmodium vinckei lentum]
MRISILKLVFFSIIICSFEYAENELHFVNERSTYLERDIIKLKNNRILADTDNQFDLNNFYGSALSLANQFSDYIGDDNDEEMIRLRNIIDSNITKHKESNTLPNLNNVDKKTKKLIYELQKELEEAKKELDNIRNNELAIQPIQDKRIIKKDENIPVSEHESFKQLENSENILEIGNYNFEDEYNEITSSDFYKKMKCDKKSKKQIKKNFINFAIFIIGFAAVVASESWYLVFLWTPQILSMIKNNWEGFKYRINMLKN